MSTSLLYHALGIRDYGRTDHFASNGRRLAASTARGSVARVRLWPWFTPFRQYCDRNMGRKKGFTGRTPIFHHALCPGIVGAQREFEHGLVLGEGDRNRDDHPQFEEFEQSWREDTPARKHQSDSREGCDDDGVRGRLRPVGVPHDDILPFLRGSE
jgi:hypothetical protein